MEKSPVRLPGAWRRPAWIAALAALSAIQMLALVDVGAVHGNDFKHLWTGGRILARGGDPYDARLLMFAARQEGIEAINPYVYPPSTGLLTRPFTFWSFAVSWRLWMIFNWALVWLCVAAGPILARWERPGLATAAGAGFLLCSLPFYRQMTAGQMNVPLVAALWGVPLLLRRGQWAPAGVILGAAAAYKISPAFMIGVLVLMGFWRAAAAAAVSLAGLCLAAEAWAGGGAHARFIPTLSQMGYGESTWAEHGHDFYRNPFNQSFNSMFHHLFTENPYSSPWLNLGPHAANGLTLLVSAGILTGVWFAAARLRGLHRPAGSWGPPEERVWWFGVLAMLLLPSLMWDHYAVQALPALMAVAGSRGAGVRPSVGLGLLAVFFLLAWPWMHLSPDWRSGWGIPLMSIRLWGVVGLGALLLDRRALE